MKITDRINAWAHPLFAKYVCRTYKKKALAIGKRHPELLRPVSPDLVKQHKDLWGRLGLRCTDEWLRFHVNVTGINDYKFCPAGIFYARIERILNDCSCSGYGIEDKNLLNCFLGFEFFPKTVFRYVRGVFLDENYQWISKQRVAEMLGVNHGDLVGKPCVLTSGGQDVELFSFNEKQYVNENKEALSANYVSERGYNSYIVQEKLLQDDFSAHFNPASTNTCRIMTLRCPWDGRVVAIKTMMRFGVTNRVCDNMSQGGLCVNLDRSGCFGKYGHDYYGQKFTSHPVTKVAFEGLTHPHYTQMASVACQLAARIPNLNLLSFDMICTKDNTVKCLEINATSQGLLQMQYDHGGIFGEYSEAVVDWCASHLELDNFKHFRTFY